MATAYDVYQSVNFAKNHIAEGEAAHAIRWFSMAKDEIREDKTTIVDKGTLLELIELAIHETATAGAREAIAVCAILENLLLDIMHQSYRSSQRRNANGVSEHSVRATEDHSDRVLEAV